MSSVIDATYVKQKKTVMKIKRIKNRNTPQKGAAEVLTFIKRLKLLHEIKNVALEDQ